MKCEKCENEAVYTLDCLVIENITNKQVTNRTYQTATVRTTKLQRAKGVEKVGLCEKCLLKRKKEANAAPLTLYLPALGMLLGLILGLIGITGKDVGGGNPVLETVGFIFAIVSWVICMIIFFFVIPQINKKAIKEKPWKAFHSLRLKHIANVDQEGTVELLIPLGDFYTDYKDFCKTNSLLIPDTQKKIYDEFILTGKWKELSNSTMPELTPADVILNALNDNDVDFKASIVALVALYDIKPEGYLTSEADEVRQIGQRLYDKGGMEMMRRAHTVFAASRPNHARNLEMVWDGIGGWRG